MTAQATTPTPDALVDPILQDLDGLLSDDALQGLDLEAGDEPAEAAEVVFSEVQVDDIADDVLKALEHSDEMETLLAKQEAARATAEAEPEPEPAEPAPATSAAKAPGRPRKPAGEAVSVTLARLYGPDDAVLMLTQTELALVPADQATLAQERREAFDKAAVKVKEKILNAFDFWKTGKTLSCYTDIAVKLLQERGTLTAAELKSLYQSGSKYHTKPYSAGTANAQAGQMMAVLPLLGVATASAKSTLSFVPDSLIAKAITAA